MDGSLDVPPCFYFQQGNCRFGEDCHYRHAQQPGANLMSICWYYQENGWCPHGRSCKFMHGPSFDYYPMPTAMPMPNVNASKRSTDQSVCIFFQRGSCKRGNNCSFLHPGMHESPTPFTSSAKRKDASQRNTATTQRSREPSGKCKELEIKENQEANESETKKRNRRRKPKSKQVPTPGKENSESATAETPAVTDIAPSQNKTESSEKDHSVSKADTNSDVPVELPKKCSLTLEQCQKVQATERMVLKQRISADNLVIKTNSKGEEYYEFEFSSSDPDWSYDFKSVPLRVSFPEDYPNSSMKVKCLSSDVLPDSITSACNKAILKWLEQRMENIGSTSQKGDLAFRPFLRWLDRRLEGIFTEGLKEYKRAMVLRASGISIWTPDKLRRALGHDSDEEEVEEKGHGDETSCDQQRMNETSAAGKEASAAGKEAATASEHHDTPSGCAAGVDVQPSGVELRLRNLQLGEDTASVLFSRVRLVLQCDRCRQPQELAMTAGQPLSLRCERCNNELMACFRPALVHPFSPVIGYFDGVGCRPVDAAFMEWKFTVTCLSCNRSIDRVNIRPGALESFKCVGCFKEQRFAFNSVHFTRLADNVPIFDSAKVQRIVSLKPKKVPKDPAIREGFPLPHEGTCKHYKKSHRWLRFPCCGRAFPCDVCHDEAVTDGHEMGFANRMICGFCCKEQAFSAERPCVACHKSMTRSRSSYWEGGKGCRDKTAMNRNDAKKYSNSNNKTVSKRSQKT